MGDRTDKLLHLYTNTTTYNTCQREGGGGKSYLEKYTEREGEGDGHHEPGHAEQQPAADSDTSV